MSNLNLFLDPLVIQTLHKRIVSIVVLFSFFEFHWNFHDYLNATANIYVSFE